jgi:regulator of protease activity HflC (stomatin/prohibitin superfamily)
MTTSKRNPNNMMMEVSEMSLKRKITLAATLVGTLLFFMGFFLVFNWEHVEGNERLVVQNFSTGVQEQTISAGTFFYVPLTTTIYKYNVGTEKFIMGNKELYNGRGSDYVDYPAYTVTTGGNGREQPATFSVTLQYRLDPTKLVSLHNKAQNNYEDLIIKPALTRIISDQATTQTVLDFYSGEGRVNLQRNIEKAITEHPELSSAGIIVETFVIDSIDLDKAYVEEITGRQLATQKKLRAIEEAKAAEEIAKKVEAEAEADKLKKIVEADANKQQKIKAAEAAAAEVELAAKADATKTKAAAEALRFSKEQDAKGLLAQGLAEAEVAQKKASAKYSGEAGARQAQVEIEQARVNLFTNMKIQGVVPEKTLLNIINGGADVKTTIPVATPSSEQK